MGKFDLTYLIDGVLGKDQPAGLVAPKKSLKTNISVNLAIALATGGRFLSYFRLAEPKRMAVFSGESGGGEGEGSPSSIWPRMFVKSGVAMR